jgi:hypothetical protein
VVVLAVWPPVVSILGVLPVAAGASQLDSGRAEVLAATRTAALAVLFACSFIVWWLERRETILKRISTGLGA